VCYILQNAVTVRDRDTLASVPANAQTTGEIMFGGNIMMRGYPGDPQVTEHASAGGWF
jgi:fatty-acyl-CoA synthase